MKRRIHHTVAALAVAGTLAPAAAAQTEEELVDGLEWVQSRMTAGLWASAKTRLVQLLDEHRGADYARVRRIEIAEDMQRCQFHLKHRPPAARDLISGRIVRQDRRSGMLALCYAPDELNDFAPPTGAMGGRFHPVVFTGPYTIDLRGTEYPSESGGVQLFVNVNESSVIAVVCGQAAGPSNGAAPMGIYRLTASGEQEELFGPAASPAVVGQRYRVSVRVGARTIEVQLDGTPLMKASKPASEFGRFGFVDRGFTELSVQGQASAGWLQGLIDAETKKQQARFERLYEPRSDLPEWLYEPVGTAAAPAPPPRAYPGAVRAEHADALDEAATLIAEEKYGEARAFLLGLSRRQMSRAARAYLLALCELALGRPEEALSQADVSCREDGDFPDSRMVRARALIQLRRPDAAIAELRTTLAKDPGYGHAYARLAVLLLEAGHLDQARDVVLDARRNGAVVPDLDLLDQTLTKAHQGPSWNRTWEYRTTHYVVASDLDQRVCIDAARLLELGYAVYQAQLATAPRTRERFRVYLFSGEAGYQKYCDHTLGSTQPHTMGLYSSSLKQLLIWNVPDRAQMLDTVRHEGFHQYLDSVMRSPPPWLNEGLAMYYEAVPPGEERPIGGMVRNDLLAALPASAIPPLSEFLALDAERFYANSPLHYPLSWAFVHFLRQTTPARRLLFRRLFEALLSGESTGQALRTALGTASLADLERDFREHVELLRSRMPAGARAPR